MLWARAEIYYPLFGLLVCALIASHFFYMLTLSSYRLSLLTPSFSNLPDVHYLRKAIAGGGSKNLLCSLSVKARVPSQQEWANRATWLRHSSLPNSTVVMLLVSGNTCRCHCQNLLVVLWEQGLLVAQAVSADQLPATM